MHCRASAVSERNPAELYTGEGFALLDRPEVCGAGMTARVPLVGDIAEAKAVGVPILRKGFRPFFLLAALFAIAIVPVWLMALGGVGGLTIDRHLSDSAWHAHELLFGYAAAVIAGFLLTAVANWTGRETLTGPWLAALCGLWLAARIAIVMPLPHPIAMGLDLAFVPALAVAIGRPLVRTQSRRNFVMLAVLGAFWLANAAVWSIEWRTRGLRFGVDVVVLLIAILTGRIVPMFTRNATRVESIHSVPALDALALVSLVAVTLADATVSSTYVRSVACAAAAVLVLARTIHWGTRHALRVPLLWILHIGHAFIPIGLAMRALPVVVPAISDSAATHAFTVGAIGCTTLGMMSRVALGHTGRMLDARAPMVVAFAAIVLAAIVRIVGPHMTVTYAPSLFLAGALWTVAFAIFLVVHAPILARSRVDGKPG